MAEQEKFCLRWSDFENNISKAFRELKNDEDFFDVTLACDGKQLQAHKVILCACSPFFKSVLKQNKHPHPLLYLKGVKYEEILSILDFMYYGEANVTQVDLSSFLATAEDLQVKGLSASGQEQQPSNHSFKSTNLTCSKQSKQPKINASASIEKENENLISIVKTESIVVDVDCDPLLNPDQQMGNQGINFPAEHDAIGYQQSYQEQMRQIKQISRLSDTSHGWNQPEAFNCHICEKSYSNKKSLQNHMTTHKGMTYCSICDKTLSSPTYLRAHMAQMHQQQPAKQV